MKRLLAVLLLAVLACAPAFAERRWLVQTADNKIIGGTDDDGVEAPDAAFATLVLDSVIRMADPPGADGVIQAGGFWDGTTYTPPAGLLPVIDPTTDAGSVQVAAHAMMDVFEAAIALIRENEQAWPAANIAQAIEGIHWQIIAAARIGLNSTRTAARRAKFMEECASWPDGVNGDVAQYVDAMIAATDFTEKWSWVNPEVDPFTRYAIMGAAAGFEAATNVEAAPSSSDLIGRAWIVDIP